MHRKFLWCDFETSGLDERECFPLEVAIVVTDEWLHEEDVLQTAFAIPHDVIHDFTPFIQDMHGKSGLIPELLNTPNLPDYATVDQAIEDLIVRVWGNVRDVLLAGSSVHFDRKYIRQYFPLFDKRLNYRHLDVSVFKEVFATYRPDWKAPAAYAEPSHRAIDDIRNSISEFQWSLDCLGIRSLAGIMSSCVLPRVEDSPAAG